MNRKDKALLKNARSMKKPKIKTATEREQYTNAIIPYRLSIQSMLENPIVKDVRGRLFGGGV